MGAANSNVIEISIAADVPTAPVLSGQVSGSTVELIWTASTVGDSTITNYLLYREVGSGGFSLYQNLSGSTLDYNDTGLANGNYSYYVVAVDARDIASPQSNTVTETVGVSANFTITAANDPDAEQTGQGYGHHQSHTYGSITGASTVFGTICAAVATAGTQPYLSVNIAITGASGMPPQTAFTKITYTGANGAQTWLAANAGYNTSMIGGNNFIPQSEDNDPLPANTATWTWETGQSQLEFAIGDQYTITIS